MIKMIEKLKPKIEKYFTQSEHGFDHTKRVYDMAVRIAKDEHADMDIVKAAALLHDIARHKEKENPKICHAEESAKMAPGILKEINFPEKKIPAVIHAIQVHRYSKGLKAETKEAEILQDADRLDALGAICIARIFAKGGRKGLVLHDPSIKPMDRDDSTSRTAFIHFYEKILKIKPETFKTRLAKEIAVHRYKFVEDFVEEFLAEWNGER